MYKRQRYVLRDVFDDATIGFDDDNNTLIVSASDDDQQRIASLVEQMDQPLSAGTKTKIYALDSFPARHMDNIVEDMVGEGEVTYDDETNVMIVTASEDQHARVKEAIDSVNNVDSKAVDRVYVLKSASSANIQNSIERLMPQVRVASDTDSNTLIVSGSDQDQARVQQLVMQLDNAPGQETVMRAYVVENADGKQTFQSLQSTFNGNGNFSLSFQEATKTIFLVATPKNHEIFSGLLTQLDNPLLAGSNRTAKTYALANMSGNAGKAAVTALLQGSTPPANVELDDFGNTLIVVGTEEQQKKVASSLGQLSGTETDLEVFELAYVDPWTVESAVDALYANQPISASPTITSDYFSNRLFVRGSTAQIDQVKSLLKKMGERSVLAKNEKGNGDVRTIPFRGDVTAAVEQIQQIWPRIRKNRIQVVAPSDPGFQIQGTQRAPAPAPAPSNSPLRLDDDDEDEGEDGNSVEATTPKALRYVALQTSTRAPAADEKVADPSNEQEPAAETPTDTPVVIVPEDDRITIASSDHEALDQLEELLSVMARTDSSETSMGSDFAVYLLRNTGAADMRQLLGDLFEQLRKNSGGGGGGSSRSGSSRSSDSRSGGISSMSSMSGFGSLFGPSFGNVAVVADDRLNALIIHGDRKERELIEELLRVLDSEDLANPIVVYQPELVTLKNTQAQRVLGILSNVYKSQLSSGGGRKKVDIPEGVSSEVASVLQQINATAGSPILSLDVDETTNSIVMRAPPELRKEIKRFVESLDTGAGGNRSRNVRVIKIQRGKSDQIREALEQFILDRRDTN